MFRDFGYTSYIIQQEQINEKELIAINTRVVLLGLASFLLICIGVIPVSKIYNQVELLWILPITGVQFILNSFTLVPYALMQRSMQFNKTGKIDVASNLASVVFGVILLLFIKSYWVLLLASTFYGITQLILTLKLSGWKHRFSNPLRDKISKSGSMFGLRLTTFNVMTFLSVTLDNIIIGKIAGPAVLGNYSKSFEFGNTNIDRLVRKPIHQVYFADLSGKTLDERSNLFFQYLFLLLSLVVLVVGPSLIFTDIIVTNLLNIKWQPLIGMLPPFFLCTILWMTMSLADQLLIVTSKLKRYLTIGFFKAVTGLTAILIGSLWGAKAIAYSFLIYHVVLFVPFCYSIFSAIHTERGRANVMLRNTCVIVASAVIAVIIPFVLLKTGVVSELYALIIFALNYLLLHKFVWSTLKYYSDFSVFVKGLIAKKVSVVQS